MGDSGDTYRIARLGIEVEAWFRTDVGQYVLARATQEIDEVFSAWLDQTKATDTEDLHRRANAARLALMWLNDAIADGQSAHRDLIEDETNE